MVRHASSRRRPFVGWPTGRGRGRTCDSGRYEKCRAPADRYKGEAQLEFLRWKALGCRRGADAYLVTDEDRRTALTVRRDRPQPLGKARPSRAIGPVVRALSKESGRLFPQCVDWPPSWSVRARLRLCTRAVPCQPLACRLRTGE